MTQTLGAFLEEAGVKGGKKPITFENLQKISHHKEIHQHKAMEQLPPRFQNLVSEPNGPNFLTAIVLLLQDTPEEEVTDHLIFGIVQLVHDMRDNTRGSRRASFKKVIPAFLNAKNAHSIRR